MSSVNNQCLISIIVPVYKVEKYLPTCIDSILAQTYQNFELVLVNDGSPDNCGKICDNYAQKDNRIKVIHQTNQGVVVARNNALKIAVGEYLTFVDSDDWLEKTFLSETIQKAQETDADIVWTDFYENNNLTQSIPENIDFKNNSQIIRFFILDKIKGFLWNKLIRRSFYTSCKVQTDEKCTILEDKYIMLQLLCSNPRMEYIRIPLYNYTYREGSAIKSTRYLFANARPNICHIYTYLKENGLFDSYKPEFCSFAMKVKFSILQKYDIDKARHFMSFAHKNIQAFPFNKPLSLFYWLCFNAPFGNHLYNVYIRLKNYHN